MPVSSSCGHRHCLHSLEERAQQKNSEPLYAGNHHQPYDGILFQPGPRLGRRLFYIP
nr:hypothetical protein SHINE37_110370 [Rhizobiaceae bacterium]